MDIDTSPTRSPQGEVSDAELTGVICDFLEMGHAENIVSMFRRNPEYHRLCGEILRDERFAVRLGLTIVFEELQRIVPHDTPRAIPALAPLLTNDSPLIRGDAVGLLGIIGTTEAIQLSATLQNDPHPQVREMVQLTLTENL